VLDYDRHGSSQRIGVLPDADGPCFVAHFQLDGVDLVRDDSGDEEFTRRASGWRAKCYHAQCDPFLEEGFSRLAADGASVCLDDAGLARAVHDPEAGVGGDVLGEAEPEVADFGVARLAHVPLEGRRNRMGWAS
jgi:hypothetical protein